MAYTTSQAFAPRGTQIGYTTNVASGLYSQLAEVMGINFSGAKFDLADTTNYESGNFREWLATLGDSGECSFEANYIPTDGSQQALLAFFNAGTQVGWQILLPNSLATITFNAFVSSLEHSLPLDKQAKLSVKLKITGKVNGF